MSMYRGNPCKDCEERYQGCHARCEMYAEWRSNVDNRKADILNERRDTYLANCVLIDSSKKRKKRRNIG